ncbi:MAG: hypothetical protein JXB10_10300 [Pirellulales bacterium]|nr:hypothetical protein [Pirellulales bacterium]
MNPIQKQALRAAGMIRRRLAERREEPTPIQLPEDHWSEMQRFIRQIQQAQRHRWHRAARRLTDDLLYQIDYCRSRLSDLLALLRQKSESPALPALKDLYQEILALQEEYDEFDVDPKTGEIRVTTEPIVLQDLRLGQFAIRLHWKSSGGTSPYNIVALEPHPAASDSSVTHPHVQSERLCEGDGRAAIRTALDQGRLGDFFQIVTQILSTYAEGSAYVELDQWYGESCSDCGGLVDEDERYYCNRCENLLCGECSTSCEHCGDGYCSGCISSCQTCQEPHCSACLEACAKCCRATCPHCLQDGLCERCYEQQQQDDRKDAPADPGGQSPAQRDAEAEFPAIDQGTRTAATAPKSLVAV